MDGDPEVVVIGGGLAGQRVCETLRLLGHEGRVRMLCEERHAPYDRPPLSKGVLSGELDGAAPLLRPERWYGEHDVELLLGARANAVDVTGRCVELADGSRLPYERLVIATGSRPRRLPALALGDFVCELRTIDDARALRELLVHAVERLVIVGAGLIGMEVACAAVALGIEVTMIESAASALERELPPPLGAWIARMHTRAGVELMLGRGVEDVRVLPRGGELRLSDGRTLRADLVVVAVGTVPATRFLAGSGLPPGALVVDVAGRTALPGVYAAGDAVCFPDACSGRPLQTAHWEAAAHQGAAVARAIVGSPAQAPPPPTFWSEQYGVRFDFVGHAEQADRLELDGDVERADFTAWLLDGERPVAALLAGRSAALPAARAAIAAGRRGAVLARVA